MTEKEKIISQIDILYNSVYQYRTCTEFRKRLEFCAQFKSMSAFNAMLIEMQMPCARYVLRADEWASKYSRVIKHDARPMIILVPFGPVSYVFDISDTKPNNNNLFLYSDEDILSEIEMPYRTKSDIDIKLLETFCLNVECHGILINPDFKAATSYAGKIELYDKGYFTYTYKKQNLSSPCDYLISINKNAKPGKFFASLCHELGHLFCHHIYSPYQAWDVRNLSNSAEEFEAEIVSWLVCERLNIGNPSEKYLASYCDNNEEIPSISIERIFTAVNDIEKMLKTKLSIKDGIKYKYDKKIKAIIDSIK